MTEGRMTLVAVAVFWAGYAVGVIENVKPEDATLLQTVAVFVLLLAPIFGAIGLLIAGISYAVRLMVLGYRHSI